VRSSGGPGPDSAHCASGPGCDCRLTRVRASPTFRGFERWSKRRSGKPVLRSCGDTVYSSHRHEVQDMPLKTATQQAMPSISNARGLSTYSQIRGHVQAAAGGAAGRRPAAGAAICRGGVGAPGAAVAGPRARHPGRSAARDLRRRRRRGATAAERRRCTTSTIR
jgi:hypothetical protein